MMRESLNSLAVVTVISSLGLLLYSYALYPALLWVLTKLTRSPVPEDGQPGDWPHVSILLSAYNEEQVISERITNLLEIDYPTDKLEILVGSDGSTDRTCDLVNAHGSQRVRLVPFERRRGKASVINDLVTHARGAILVLTDANTFFAPDAVGKLVTALSHHPSASAVVGRLELRSAVHTGNLDGLYWRYETWIKRLESHFGSVLGANGAIYAVRRERYWPLPSAAVVDDLLVPMLIRLHRGGRVFFVSDAHAYETSPVEVRHEFRRRIRIGAGDLQALTWTWPLLLPWKGMVALAYFSHKVLRWAGPLLLLIAFLANVWLLAYPLFRWLLAAQVGFYSLGLLATRLRVAPVVRLPAAAARYFIVLNVGLLLGFLRFVVGAQRPFWGTAPREGDSTHAAIPSAAGDIERT